MTVISTVSMVVSRIKKLMSDEYEITKAVFDPELTYTRGAPLARIDNNYRPKLEQKSLPLMLYNRSVLRSTQQGNRGYKNTYDRQGTTSDAVSYRSARCEFDLRFMYISKDIAQTEKFEILYNAHLGFSSNTEVDIDLGELGSWKYYLKWNYPLEDVMLNIDGSSYRSISGMVNVEGNFTVMTGTLPLITDVYSSTYTMYDNELISNEHVSAEE